jgi:hypothetical protein
MGVVETIDYDRFPKQNERVGSRVDVVFRYDTTRRIGGVLVRDDFEEPWQTIIALDDGRYVLSTECQYSYADFGGEW